jgi:hypothetical protein
MIQAIKTRLAIRSYRNKLGPYLEQQYGWRATYSTREVRAGANSLGLSSASLCFAYAMFCSRADFDAHHAVTGESCDYDAMKSQVAGIESASDHDGHTGDAESGWFDSGGDGSESGGGDDGGSGGGSD